MNTPYKIALIGMGKMGRIRFEVLNRSAEVTIAGLCDVNAAVEEEFPDIPYFASWEDLLDAAQKNSWDAIFVGVYSALTAEVVISALSRGLHVFSEKPPGISLKEIEAIQEAEKRSGKVLKFGFNHRYHGSVMEAKRLLDEGKIGSALWARGVYGKAGGEEFAQNWRGSKTTAGGGILLDQGIHMLDLLRYYLGDFSSVQSFVEQAYFKETDLEDNAFAMLRTDEGQVAMLHSSATHWNNIFRLEIYGETGFLKLEGILSNSMQYAPETLTVGTMLNAEGERLKKPLCDEFEFKEDRSWSLEVNEFLQLLAGRDVLRHGHSEDAYQLMKCLDAIYAS